MSDLRETMIMKLDQRLHDCAAPRQDKQLLAQLSAGDVIAQEFKYHPACLVGFCKRVALRQEVKRAIKDTSLINNALI